MNPLYILLSTSISTILAVAVTCVLPSFAADPKARRWFIATPLIVGAMFYGGSVVAANFVQRDALAATRTAVSEVYWSAADAQKFPNGYPDVGEGYADLVKHGQTGTTQTANGYTISFKNANDGMYTTELSYNGKTIYSDTREEMTIYEPSQKWVQNYPRLPIELRR